MVVVPLYANPAVIVTRMASRNPFDIFMSLIVARPFLSIGISFVRVISPASKRPTAKSMRKTGLHPQLYAMNADATGAPICPMFPIIPFMPKALPTFLENEVEMSLNAEGWYVLDANPNINRKSENVQRLFDKYIPMHDAIAKAIPIL